MASIKQRIIKCLADYATLYSDLQHEIVKCTKSLSDLGGNSQLGLLEQQIDTQKQRVSGVVDALIEKDKELQILLRELVANQEYQQKIVRVKQLVSEKDAQLSNLSGTLERVHTDLLGVMHNSSHTTKALTTKKEVFLDEVVSYAHRISGTTSATSLDPNDIKSTPFPPPHIWAASLLYPKNRKTILQKEEEQEMAVDSPTSTQASAPLLMFNTQSQKKTESAPIQIFGLNDASSDSDSDSESESESD